MSRLTTNKPVDEMSMLELVYNSCCVSEDGSAMYKDFETVRDARDFVRNLYKVHLNEEMPTDDDIFDESMIDELQYEPEVHLNGLIALFYRNLWAMADLRETLKVYEDKEEQGLLLELPVRIGEKVFSVVCGEIEIDFLASVSKDKDGLWAINHHGGIIGLFGHSVFATETEAEEALAKMGGK